MRVGLCCILSSPSFVVVHLLLILAFLLYSTYSPLLFIPYEIIINSEGDDGSFRRGGLGSYRDSDGGREPMRSDGDSQWRRGGGGGAIGLAAAGLALTPLAPGLAGGRGAMAGTGAS